MSLFNTLLSNARPLALIAAFSVSLVLPGCGGGGGGGDDEDELITNLTALSTPDLDGVVYGDNLTVRSRPDFQPTVGDGEFISSVNSGPVRFQAYWSFDVAAIPAGARIKSATLSLYNRTTLGDPQGMSVVIRVDHVNYGSVFPTALFSAPLLDSNFATISNIGTLGRKDVDVTEQLQADVDAGRIRSQYRLRGAISSNFDSVNDVALLTDGEDSQGTGEVPMLIIELE